MSMLQRILGCLPFALLVACSGSGSRSDSSALLVVLRDYKTGQQLELASESHTDRVAFYSTTRGDAARKIQTDEVMSAFVDQLEELGLGEHAREGRAPSIGSGEVIRWGLELDREGARSHWLIGSGSAADDWQAFQECRDTFVELYNITVSFQAVQNESGAAFFGDGGAPAAAGRKR